MILNFKNEKKKGKRKKEKGKRKKEIFIMSKTM